MACSTGWWGSTRRATSRMPQRPPPEGIGGTRLPAGAFLLDLRVSNMLSHAAGQSLSRSCDARMGMNAEIPKSSRPEQPERIRFPAHDCREVQETRCRPRGGVFPAWMDEAMLGQKNAEVARLFVVDKSFGSHFALFFRKNKGSCPSQLEPLMCC